MKKFDEKTQEFVDAPGKLVYVLCEEVITECYDVLSVYSKREPAIDEMRRLESQKNGKHYIVKEKRLDCPDYLCEVLVM